MPLQIQPDESLVSYVKRNVYLNWPGEKGGIFERLATRQVLNLVDVKEIAEAMGWPGCYGFNRLVHGHTMMAAAHVFKGEWDHSYSGNQYVRVADRQRFSVWDASFCPECVREDLQAIGYSYWRRYGSPHVTVCYKHNAVLLDRCPFCYRPFTRLGHDLDVMWRKCRGRHLAEAHPVANNNHSALRRARIYHRLCTSKHYISDELAVLVARDKAASLIECLEGHARTRMKARLRELRWLAEGFEYARSKNCAPTIYGINLRLRYALVEIYEIRDDFEHDLNMIQGADRSVDSLWSTYHAGGHESPHFVEEDYALGVGYWTCPNPRPLSDTDFSYDSFIARRPKIYPCCNFPHPVDRRPKLKPFHVTALPGIPRVSMTETSSVRADSDGRRGQGKGNRLLLRHPIMHC